MHTIWKYSLIPTSKFKLEMPQGAQVLTVQVQRGEAFIWAEVDTDKPKEWRTFHIVGTGHEMPDCFVKYIGTFQLPEAGLVLHLFEDDDLPF